MTILRTKRAYFVHTSCLAIVAQHSETEKM